ncbi:MAG TPA: tetratricopeptide repeat protein [Ktedonobacterales bacterium]|jgi:tetratricopeptide (TPR) repeat protein
MDTSTTPEPTHTKRDALLEVIALARTRAQTLAEGYNAEARTAVGTVEVWAPKDHFVHVAVWTAYQARRIEASATGNPPPTKPADNDTVFLQHRDARWETIWADWMQALDETAAAVRRTSDEDLTALDPNGRSLFSLTLNNLYLHPISHLAQLYAERGDAASAEQVQQEAVATMARLFSQGELYANTIYGEIYAGAVYELGCFYAKCGRSAEAIAQVREALAAHPKLADVAKADANLVSLHALPEYQALFPA